MKRLAVLLLLLFATPAFAQELELGFHHAATKIGGDTGTLDVADSRGFGASAELFFRPHVSTRLSATLINPAAILFPTTGGDVDLGTLGIRTYAATARYHWRNEARLSLFAGGGAALVSLGTLDDRFGDEVYADFDDQITFVGEAGLRMRVPFERRIALEATVSYAPVSAEPRVRETNVALPRDLKLDPFTISVGATWRF